MSSNKIRKTTDIAYCFFFFVLLPKKCALDDNYAFGHIFQEVNLAIYFMMGSVKETKTLMETKLQYGFI